MLYKESAIAVMVAMMLGAASLFGGLSFTSALATHDPDATEIASEQISQEDTDSIIVDSVELTAEKSTLRSMGTLTVHIVQNDSVLRTANIETSEVKTSPSVVKVDVANINITGSFDIVVEYLGTGLVTVSEIDIEEGTQVASEPENNDEPTNNNPPDQPQEQDEFENTIASKTVVPESDDGMVVNVVEFTAKKSTLRTGGMLAIAIVQDGKILGEDTLSTDDLKTSYQNYEASFDDLELTDEFDIVFMFEGSGAVFIKSIEVDGATEPAGNPEDPSDPAGPPADGMFSLVVEAKDQNGDDLSGLWVALLNGNNQLVTKGFTEHNATFTLEAGKSYIVEMGDFYNEETQTAYEFEGWQDHTNDSTRRSVDLTKFGSDNAETFTAEYTVTGNAPPPQNNGGGETTSPPPDSPDGTITAYAYRIPSEHWGPTFVSANAEMYFVVYNSTGWIVYSGFFDETGHIINGLSEGETFWISPTDCDECHGDPHDVVFDHWEDGSTERQRPVVNGMSVGAYYAYDPDP